MGAPVDTDTGEVTVVRVPETRGTGRVPASFRAGRKSARSWVAVGFGLGLGAVLAYLLVKAVLQIQGVLMMVVLSLVIAIGVEPIVAWLTSRGAKRRWAVTGVLVTLTLATAGLFALFIPPVTTEITALVNNVPLWLQQLHDHHSTLGRFEDQYHLVAKAKQQLGGSGAGSVAGGVLGAGQILVSTVTDVFLVITLTLYFVAGLPTLKRFGLKFVPGSSRERVESLTDEVLLRTGRYMLANVGTSVIAGLATFFWLLAWNVPYPAALGVFVGVMDLIPMVGSTVGGIVVSLVALVVSLPVAIATAVFYIVFRVAEDYLIVPRAMKFAVEVHPMVTILAVLVGGALLGLIGALIAIPVAVAVGLFLDESLFPRIAAR